MNFFCSLFFELQINKKKNVLCPCTALIYNFIKINNPTNKKELICKKKLSEFNIKKIKKITATSIPMWSPTIVLTGPDIA